MARSNKPKGGSIHVHSEFATEHDIREWQYLLEIRRQLIERSSSLHALWKFIPRYRDISANNYGAFSDAIWLQGFAESRLALTDKEKQDIKDAIEHHGTHLLSTWCRSYQDELDTREFIGENPDKRSAVNHFFALMGFISDGMIPPAEFLIYLSLRFHDYLESDQTLGNILFGLPKQSKWTTARARYKKATRNRLVYELAMEIRALNPGIKTDPLATKTLEILLSEEFQETQDFEDYFANDSISSVDSIRKIIKTFDETVAQHGRRKITDS